MLRRIYPQENAELAFSVFTTVYHKKYETQEEHSARLGTFKKNVAYMTAFNAEPHSYQVGVMHAKIFMLAVTVLMDPAR